MKDWWKPERGRKQNSISWPAPVLVLQVSRGQYFNDYRLCSLKVPKVEGKEIQSLPRTCQPAGDNAASIILHSLQVKELGKESEDREKAVEKDEQIMKITAASICAMSGLPAFIPVTKKQNERKPQYLKENRY